MSSYSSNRGKGKRSFTWLLVVFFLIVVVLVVIGVFFLLNHRKNQGALTISQDAITEYENGDIVYHPSEENLAYDEDNYAIYYDNVLIVYLLSDLSDEDATALADQVGGVVAGDLSGSVNLLQIVVPSTDFATLNSYADTLMESENVLYATYDMPMEISESADENPWSADGTVIEEKGNEADPDGNDWWAEAIGAYTAWDYVDSHSDELTDISVGILDNGFQCDHSDLPNITMVNENSMDSDDTDHGTHVAGIIAAQNNEIGIRGIADKANLICADWSQPEINEDGMQIEINLQSTGEWINVIKQMIDIGASVINNSWGSSLQSEEEFAKNTDSSKWINKICGTYETYCSYFEAYARRTAFECIILIAELLKNTDGNFLLAQAAGNGYDGSGSKGYDASKNGFFCAVTEDLYQRFSNEVRASLGCDYANIKGHILIVGAIQNSQKKGNYKLRKGTNFGTVVDICAPGDEIFSTSIDSGYATHSGTSMAAPMVTAAAALVWSIDPSLSAAEVKAALCNNTTTSAVGVTGEDKGNLYPMLNVGAAVQAVAPQEEIEISEYFENCTELVDLLEMEQTESWAFASDTSYVADQFYLEWYHPSYFYMKNEGASYVKLYGISLGDSYDQADSILSENGWSRNTNFDEENGKGYYFAPDEFAYYLTVYTDETGNVSSWQLDRGENVVEDIDANGIWATYDDILNEYKAAVEADLEEGVASDKYPHVNNVAWWDGAESNLYYAYYDIDGNGVQELLIKNEEVVIDAYSLYNYTPNHAVEAAVTLGISTSLGFGGHNGCLAFRKFEA